MVSTGSAKGRLDRCFGVFSASYQKPHNAHHGAFDEIYREEF